MIYLRPQIKKYEDKQGNRQNDHQRHLYVALRHWCGYFKFIKLLIQLIMFFNSQQRRQRKLACQDQKPMVIHSVELTQTDPDSRGVRKSVRKVRPFEGEDALCPLFYDQMSITSLASAGINIAPSFQEFGSLNRDLEASSQVVDYLEAIDKSGALISDGSSSDSVPDI